MPLIRPCRTREGAWDGRFHNPKFRPLDLRIRTTTSTIVDSVAYSQKVDIPESFIVLVFINCIFIERVRALSRSQNDKNSNI